MKRRKKELTTKQIEAIHEQTNWDYRLEILTLKNQGWSYRDIAKKLNVTHQAIADVYKKIEHLTIEELQAMANEYSSK